MRLMLHTLKKDVRRLWPAAVVLWVMFAALASAEFGRALSDNMIGEGLLTLLTTMAWACLVALAVLEEPLVGDRNFWTTRPHRWPSLLGAKLLFAALAIHIPSFLVYMIVLAARGYSPAAAVGPLLWKQVVFFGVITLASVAVASLVRNFTQFVLVVFAAATGLLALESVFGNFIRVNAGRHDEVRNALVLTFVALVALAAIRIQYARRSAITARVTVIAGALVALALLAFLPARADYAMHGASPQAPPQVSLRNAPLGDALRPRSPGSPSAALPIEILPGAGDGQYHVTTVKVEVEDPGGRVFRSGLIFGRAPDIYPYLTFPSNDPSKGWLTLSFSRAVSEAVKSGRVHIRGTVAFDYYRSGQTTTISTQGRQRVPDLGWCTTVPQIDQFSGTPMALKLVCDSLTDRPAASVALRDEASGWKSPRQGMGSPVLNLRAGTNEKWFSPLHIGESYFHILTPSRSTYPGATEFMIPEAYVPSARFEITPEIPTGHAMVDFDFGESSLAPWITAR